ncbi:MAG: nuclear transport factor 2 family protein [Flavobacteriaceae bacterium]|nr:nuclear transport factor 2 family protein [Flavobacteriaceae bacterium]
MNKSVQIIQNMYDSFAKGDVEAVLSMMSADIEWNEAENFPYDDGNPYIGPDAILSGVFARLGEEWEYFKLADLQVMGMENDMVLGTGRYQAKHKKTGKEINAQMAHLWQLKNGKVISFQQYADTKQVSEAVI